MWHAYVSCRGFPFLNRMIFLHGNVLKLTLLLVIHKVLQYKELAEAKEAELEAVVLSQADRMAALRAEVLNMLYTRNYRLVLRLVVHLR